MIEPKTKEQKKQDQNKVFKALEACAKVCKEFTRDMYDSELDVRWLRVGVLSDILDADRSYNSAKSTEKETHTFTSYDDDNKSDLWNNSTHIDRYKTE